MPEFASRLRVSGSSAESGIEGPVPCRTAESSAPFDDRVPFVVVRAARADPFESEDTLEAELKT